MRMGRPARAHSVLGCGGKTQVGRCPGAPFPMGNGSLMAPQPGFAQSCPSK